MDERYTCITSIKPRLAVEAIRGLNTNDGSISKSLPQALERFVISIAVEVAMLLA